MSTSRMLKQALSCVAISCRYTGVASVYCQSVRPVYFYWVLNCATLLPSLDSGCHGALLLLLDRGVPATVLGHDCDFPDDTLNTGL
jgi:hypothetical protein